MEGQYDSQSISFPCLKVIRYEILYLKIHNNSIYIILKKYLLKLNLLFPF